MSCEAVICDWNGTIIDYRDEKPVLEAVAGGVFLRSAPFHPFRMARILKARQEMEALYREKRRDGDFDYVCEMFRIYNLRIIKGLPVSLVQEAVDRYARKPRTQTGLDHKILRPLKECHEKGITTGIFSAGFRYGIDRILGFAGYRQYFDFCEADDLEIDDGRAAGFPLRTYRKKSALLPGLLTRHRLDASRTAYMGDSEDDEGCFEIVGYPVVPFLAPEQVKETYARKYRAFVPETEQELRDYLVKI
jgi:phosphoserine phosphatase